MAIFRIKTLLREQDLWAARIAEASTSPEEWRLLRDILSRFLGRRIHASAIRRSEREWELAQWLRAHDGVQLVGHVPLLARHDVTVGELSRTRDRFGPERFALVLSWLHTRIEIDEALDELAAETSTRSLA